MRKLTKKVLATAIVAMVAVGVGSMAACSNSAPELVDTYYSYINTRVICMEDANEDYYISDCYTVALYSDNTYVCQVDVTELSEGKGDKGEMNKVGFGDDDGPMHVVTSITRMGTYTIDNDGRGFTLTLGKADRIIYTSNGTAGHSGLLVQIGEERVNYIDSAEIDTSNFSSGLYGTWDDFCNTVGKEVTLTGDSVAHVIDNTCTVFDYKSPLFNIYNRQDLADKF